MRTLQKVCGIDVAKDTLHICYHSKTKVVNTKFNNTGKGHLQLLKKIGLNRVCVMESTGIYSLKLACTLKEKGIDVRVEHGLVVRRFIQMNMERHKSDKSDAEWIFRYGLEREGSLWKLPPMEKQYGTQLLKAINMYSKQGVMLQNHLASLKHYPFINDKVIKSVDATKLLLKKQKADMEGQLKELMAHWNQDLYKLLLSIPSLGEKTVACLMVFTDCFTKFENHSQLIAFAGLSPREYSSGISVNKKKGICKMGNTALRSSLYMCAMNAIRSNRPCRAQYERLKANGKKSKVAIIAVCNKLLKQAFSIAKSGKLFDETYKSTLAPTHK